MSNAAISHWEVSYLAAYPSYEGERRFQVFYSQEEAEMMRKFYDSLGHRAEIKAIGREYQYPA